MMKRTHTGGGWEERSALWAEGSAGAGGRRVGHKVEQGRNRPGRGVMWGFRTNRRSLAFTLYEMRATQRF